jgi:SAM-dependent methyltransferase
MSRPFARGPYAARLEYFRHVLARYHGTTAGTRRLLELTQGDGSLGSAFRRQGYRVTTLPASAPWPRVEFPGFDVVCCCEALDDRRRSLLVRLVARLLRPGGVLLYGSVRRRPRAPWLGSGHLLDPNELERALRREGLAPGELVGLEDGRPGTAAYAASAVRMLGSIPEPSGRWCYDRLTERWTFTRP